MISATRANRPAADRVLVIGAGIAGLSAAAALGQVGIGMKIAEIKDEVSSDGTRIQQPANAIRALAEIGVLDDIIEQGCHWNHMQFFRQSGELAVLLEHASPIPPLSGRQRHPAPPAAPDTRARGSLGRRGDPHRGDGGGPWKASVSGERSLL